MYIHYSAGRDGATFSTGVSDAQNKYVGAVRRLLDLLWTYHAHDRLSAPVILASPRCGSRGPSLRQRYREHPVVL